MKRNTRNQLLATAELLFSQKGFYGASIKDIAAQVGVSKQALLHHFPSKEKLYAAVLQTAADHLKAFIHQAKAGSDAPTEQLLNIFNALSTADGQSLRVIMLLMRELLDNRERIEVVHKWYLRPFLDELTGIVEQARRQGRLLDRHALAFVYQLLGATQYYVISLPTLRNLYNETEFESHKASHLALLRQLLDL